MTDYKLVPAEPTPEMMKAFCVATKAVTTEEWEDPLYDDQVADVLKNMPPAYRAMLAAAPAVQGEPVAWIRKWSLDGEKATKERNKNGRMAYPMKYKLHEVTRNRCLPDDVALYAAPQPAEQQPDMDQLGGFLAWLDAFVAVSEQAGIDDHEEAWTWPAPPADPGFFDSYPKLTAGDLRAVHAALAAYRKQGGES